MSDEDAGPLEIELDLRVFLRRVQRHWRRAIPRGSVGRGPARDDEVAIGSDGWAGEDHPPPTWIRFEIFPALSFF